MQKVMIVSPKTTPKSVCIHHIKQIKTLKIFFEREKTSYNRINKTDSDILGSFWMEKKNPVHPDSASDNKG